MNEQVEQALSAKKPDLARLCADNAVRRLAVFGSALSNDFRPTSDVDLLVEFDEGRTPGLAFFRLQRHLSELLGRVVDLNTPAMLDDTFRGKVIGSSVEIYAH